MLPVYVPALRPLIFTTAVMVPLLVPDVAPLKLRNGPAVTAADQFNVPPPVLLTATVRLAGLPPPCVAVKDNEVGLSPMSGYGFPRGLPALLSRGFYAPAAVT